MWLLLGGKTKLKQVPGGRVVTRRCAPCGVSTTHVECDVRDQVSAFFMTFVDATQRRLVCVECGEDLAMEEAAAAAPAAPAPAAAPPRAPAPHPDDLLAALKKKMGL